MDYRGLLRSLTPPSQRDRDCFTNEPQIEDPKIMRVDQDLRKG